MSTSQRTNIFVVNSNDSGEGSLRKAIQKGNELVKAGQTVEIVFSKGFHIKPLKGYQLEKGDWVFNKTKRMNIIIDGEKTEGPLFTIGNPENILASKTVEDIPNLKVDVHRIHLINSHVTGGSTEYGGGGGLGAGAALLHWNGHVSWSNSSFQGNTVEGGKGKISRVGDGRGTNRYGWGIPGPLAGNNPRYLYLESKAGQSGGVGGGFNQLEKVSRDPTKNGRGGSQAKYGYSDIKGRAGKDGGNGMNFGEGGDGGGHGGGGTWQDGTSEKPYGHGSSSWLGGGGAGGNGGNGAYGAGGGAPGLPGGSASSGYAKHNGFGANGSSKSFNNRWKPAATGKPGEGGEWGTSGTQGGRPTYKPSLRSHNGFITLDAWEFVPAERGRGGDGAALGIISSFATETAKSSLKLDDVDLRKNNASGGDNAGKFTNIFSRHIPIQHNYVTHSTTDRIRGDVLSGTQLNTSANTTDKTETHQYSGKFQQDITATQNLSDNIIYSTSHQTDLNTVQSFGNTYQLGKDGGHIIALSAEEKDQDIKQLQIEGSEQLIEAVSRINKAANRTQTEQEIRSTHKGLFGSVTGGKVFGAAKDAASEAASGAASEAVDKFASKIGMSAAGKIGALAGLGGMALVFETVMAQQKEDARIEKELKKKREIDKEREAIQKLIPTELKVSKFSLTQTRTFDVFNNFEIGRDQIVLGSFIRPALAVNTNDGVTSISINAIRTDLSSDNKPKKIAEIKLTRDQTKDAAKHRNEQAYFERLLQPVRTNGDLHYVFSKETTFQEVSRNSDAQPGGIANDKIIIKRNSEIGNDVKLEINGYEGDDRIIGDNGFSILKGEVGSDFFDPKEGNDTIDGGRGIDTVSYLSITKPVNLVAKSNGNINVTNSQLADTIEDIEVIRTWAGSTHDLSKAKKSTLQDLSKAKKSTLQDKGGYSIFTGSKSSITGSNYDDIFTISFSSSFNNNPESIFENLETQKPNQSASSKSIIKGGAGTNILILDALGAHINQGIEFKFRYDQNEKKGMLYKVSGNQELEVIDFDGIDNVIFTDAEQSSNGTLKSKAASDELSIAVSAAWEADVLEQDLTPDWQDSPMFWEKLYGSYWLNLFGATEINQDDKVTGISSKDPINAENEKAEVPESADWRDSPMFWEKQFEMYWLNLFGSTEINQADKAPGINFNDPINAENQDNLIPGENGDSSVFR